MTSKAAEKKQPLTLHQKLLEIKKKLVYIKKDAEKGQDPDSFAHVTSTNVLVQINPLLNKYGILLETRIINKEVREVEVTVFPPPKELPQGLHEKEHYEAHKTSLVGVKHTEVLYILDMQYKWVDTESKEELTYTWAASGHNGLDRGLATALTHSEKYFLLKFFNIPTDDYDPDKIANRVAKIKQKTKVKTSDKLAEGMLPPSSDSLDVYKIVDCNGMVLPGPPRFLEESNKVVDKLNFNGEHKPYASQKYESA